MELLVVEDDAALLLLLEKALTEAGYTVRKESNGMAAWTTAQDNPFDLILLDGMLPDLDGFAFCRRARAAHMRLPILLLTARDTLKDKVEGLDAGADDYIVKPFQVAELLARIRALLRRGAVDQLSAKLAVGDLTLDTWTRIAQRGNRTIHLSATEFTLLEYLMRNSGQVLTRARILEHVWTYDFGGNDNVLDVYIGYLRGKIDRGFTSSLLHTVRGVGFVMEARQRP